MPNKPKPFVISYDLSDLSPAKAKDIRLMPQELSAYKELRNRMRHNMNDEEAEAAVKAFEDQYGRGRVSFYDDLMSREHLLSVKSANLPHIDSQNGFISRGDNSHVGVSVSGGIDGLLSESFSGVDFDPGDQFRDGDYIIRRGVDASMQGNEIWVVIDTKYNSVSMHSGTCTQLIPRDLYVGPYTGEGAGYYRHSDGKVDQLHPNSDKDVQHYLELLRECPGVRYSNDAEFIARYIVTPEELRAANDVMSMFHEKRLGDLDVGPCLQRYQLDETYYMAIAKLIPFKDNYADMKLLHCMDVYTNADDGERIKDDAVIDRIRSKYNEFRDAYYGDTPMTQLLETELQLSLNAHDNLRTVRKSGVVSQETDHADTELSSEELDLSELDFS